MSNQFLKLRRSAVPGKIPDTGSIELGEIALNTHDGLAYMKKSGSNGEEIIAIGTGTSGSFTGSFTGNFTGSFTGSLQGTSSYAVTASYALQALSSSYANIAGFAQDYVFTSSLLEYYVDRRFTGGCEVTILADKTISSSNASYLTQLSASRIGDPNHPWPDPWSANLIASSSIASGQSTSARIIVKTGNTYTYGSSVLTQNGDLTGSLTNNLQPDIAVSQSNYNLRVFDLITPNVEYYFEPESSLYNINKSWQHMLVSYSSNSWDTAPEFKITGQGKFVMVYGQSSGFAASWGILASPRAEVTFEANHVIQNMWNGWEFYGQKVNVDVDKWWTYSGWFLRVGGFTYDWPSQSLAYPSYSLTMPVANVNINELLWGQDLFGGIAPHANDFWTGLGFRSIYGTDYNVNINKFYFRATRLTDGVFRYWPTEVGGFTTSSNATININVNHISGSRINVGGGLFRMPGSVDNMFLNINVKKFDAWGSGFGTTFGCVNVTNSTFKYHCDDYRNYLINNHFYDPCIRVDIGSTSPSSSYNNLVVVSGNYRNYALNQRIVSFTVGGPSATTNQVIQNTLILDNFRAYNFGTGSVNNSCIEIANPVSYVNSSGSYVVIKDSILYTSASNIINNFGTNTGSIIIDSTKMNSDTIGSKINIQGSYDVTPDLVYLIR